MREEKRRKKISKMGMEKRDKGEKERALQGKIAETEKRRQKVWNEKEVSSDRGKVQGGRRSQRKKERSKEYEKKTEK